MNSGLLLFLNFLSILFWAEVEMLGKVDARFPALSKIMKFRMIAGERWLKIYAIFLILFVLLVLSSILSKKSHSASALNFLCIAALQLVVFAFVLISIKKNRGGQ